MLATAIHPLLAPRIKIEDISSETSDDITPVFEVPEDTLSIDSATKKVNKTYYIDIIQESLMHQHNFAIMFYQSD
jgi:hypothetical protein